jgi:hypothetical protein
MTAEDERIADHGGFRPPLEEPAVHHPRLVALVDAVRNDPAPATAVDAHAVHVGWQQRRAGQRRGLALGLAVAAAVLLTVGVLELGSATRDEVAPVAVEDAAPSRAPDARGPTPASEVVAPAPDAAGSHEPTPPDALVLASSIHVASLDPGTTAMPEVLGPRRLRLLDGHWSIDVEDAEPVEVELPDGMLRLRGGSLHVQVAGDVAHVEVLRDEVLRIDLAGRSTTLRAKPPGEPAAGPSAAELAREAEELMAAGDRQGAIRALRRLVTRHGRSAAAQAGLIDLGRLLKAAGHNDEARCAYGLFLARWPGHALAGDVARAREALGAGPACDGLRPRG